MRPRRKKTAPQSGQGIRVMFIEGTVAPGKGAVHSPATFYGLAVDLGALPF